MKKLILLLVVIVVVGAGIWWYQAGMQSDQTTNPEETDTGEHSDLKQDLVLIVGGSIVGKWRSTEDAKFTREFKNDGTAVDQYGGEVVTSGEWRVFTKEKALAVEFTLEADTAYPQLVMAGSQAEQLNFKLTKLTPEELELIYMDRGGVLKFVRAE